MANPIREKLKAHARGYAKINAYEADLQKIYHRARFRIERELSSFMQRKGASFTGPRLVSLFDDLNEMFPEFEEEYRETYEHALEYMAHQNYAAALYDMGLKDNIVGSMDRALFRNMRDDGFQHIAGATRRMKQEVVSELRRISARVMRESALTGEPRATVSRRLVAELLYGPDSKLTKFQFIDAAGRRWQTDKYFQMLGRTLLHNNARECYLAGCAKSGSDIVTVSISGNCCKHCGKWENVLLSISGKTSGLPTLQDAMDEGLFHPNCTHRLMAVPESIARKYYGLDGGSGKSAGEQQSHTGQTGSTRQQAPFGFFGGKKPERFEGKLFQGDLTPDAAKLKKRLEKDGAAPEQIDAILWNHNAKMQELMGRAPRFFFHEKINIAKTIPGTTETHLAKSPNDWNGHPMTITHEYGHSFYNTLLKKKPELIEQFSRCALKDKEAFLKHEWPFSFGCLERNDTKENYREILTRQFFGEKKKYSDLSDSERWKIIAKADILGDITDGEYGFGHLSYSKEDFSEAFGNMYLAVKYDWKIFETDYPAMWKFMKGLLDDR